MERVAVPRRRVWWAVALVVMLAGLMLACVGSAAADPSQGGGGSNNTYGFNSTCDELHDGVSNSLNIPYIGDLVGNDASGLCKGANVATHPGDAASAAVDKAWDTAFGKVVDSLMDGMGQALVLSLTWWTKLPNARLLDSDTLFDHIADYTYQLQVWLLALSVILGAVRLGLARRQMAAEHAEESFKALARSTFATWTAGGVIFAAARASDAFSNWVITDSTGGNARSIAELMVQTSKFQAFSPGLVFVLAVVGIIGALAMCVLTIVRQGLMVVAVGIYPLAAAASGTRGGLQSFQKLTAWIIAFLLFKPLASLVYMIAFVTADTGNTAAEASAGAAPQDTDAAQQQLVGVVLLCCAVFVLPAIMRLVAPVVAAVGSGGGGAAAAGAALVAGAAVMTGGKALAARGTSGTASTGSSGFVGKATGTGGVGGAGGGNGGGPPSGGGGGGGARPPGTKPGGAKVASAVAAGASGVNRAGNDAAGDSPAGESWTNPSPDLGRHRIPK